MNKALVEAAALIDAYRAVLSAADDVIATQAAMIAALRRERAALEAALWASSPPAGPDD